jgi:hypothetical protein
VSYDVIRLVQRLPQKTPGAMVDAFALRFLQRSLAAADRQAFVDYAGEGRPADQAVSQTFLVERARGLITLFLSSPHFQWR